jgi:hypothetical protein
MQNVSATDKLLGRSTAGAGNVEEITCTSFARGLLDDADAATARATIGVSAANVLATEQATTSGTSIDFTSIPAGTTRITIMLVGVSTSGTSKPIIQIGDSGGIETSGYVASSSSMSTAVGTATTALGFAIRSEAAANALHGQIILSLEDSSDNTWVCHGALKIAAAEELILLAGSKALSGTLDRIRLTTQNGTDTFDAGVINIQYS